MRTSERYLLGPKLLLGLCSKDLKAITWAQNVKDADCVLSRLTIAIVRSVINSGATTELARKSWHHTLDATVSRMESSGATLVDLNEIILDKFHEYRTYAPLDCTLPNDEVVPVAQDVRMLITTAAVMDLVFSEYDDIYMSQLKNGTSVRVQAL